MYLLNRKLFLFKTVIIFFIVSGCAANNEDIREIYISGNRFRVEIADKPEERQKGLMHRKNLEPGRGMLFIFEDEKRRSFWMKNTLIPLSIAYINSSGIITDIKDMTPLNESPVRSSEPVMYALEVNRGEFKSKDISIGDSVDFGDIKELE